ncbi:MAG: tetratricopeptide repeat protein, partial [Polyangiaceae bacterium]
MKTLGHLAGLALLFATTACAPVRGAAYELDFACASRAEGAGRFLDAARSYDDAARVALRPRDRDQATWDAAEVLASAGSIPEAIRRFSAIAADPLSEHEAEAAYRIAALRIDHGDPDRGWSELDDLVRRYPSHGVAHVALRRLARHADEEGPAAGLEMLQSLDSSLDSTELAGLLSYLIAQHLEATGQVQKARDAYIRLADRFPYPFGAFFDDALWNASLIDDKLGRPRVAIDDLERMLKERETTFLMGSYERAKYVPAILRVGALYRDRLHDDARARAAFHRLYTDFAHSTMRARGLWLEAALWKKDGDSVTACDRLGTLIKSFPDSRYVPCALNE